MNDFKSGDIIIGPVLGSRYVFVAKMGTDLFAYRESEGPLSVARFNVGLNWQPAPKPFFEVGKTYTWVGGTSSTHYTMHYVFEMAGRRYAAALNGRGEESIWNEEEFRQLREV